MGISRRADVRDKPARSTFKAYAIGYVHIAIAEVLTEEGKLQLFIDAYDHARRFKTLPGLTP